MKEYLVKIFTGMGPKSASANFSFSQNRWGGRNSETQFLNLLLSEKDNVRKYHFLNIKPVSLEVIRLDNLI